jgi:hydrogenase nickel incorporation protein HypB
VGRLHRYVDGVAHTHVDPVAAPKPRKTPLGNHSGYATGRERVQVLERIFDENDRVGAQNRRDFDQHRVRAVNLMSSPGAGKTTLLHETLLRMAATTRIGIVEGDIETSLDADRLAGLGAAVALINTGDGFGGECHLDAPMVRSALAALDLDLLDLVLIENVGNLVCPAEFDVGAHAGAMVYAITEGEEKPLKYPVMFRAVQLVIVNKMDLLPHLDFDLDLFYDNLGKVNPAVTTIEVSARTGAGVDAFCDWLGAPLVGNPASG